ncbi:Adenylate kinase [Giardia duodenalis assemblage B]|uniref:Adenylate kinase n=1 Tax=Giardia duodenalis assemblage B TaxID=1394984 RepID=A0A132NTR9_GIAIN|nr:Adenylate kinase [Giardia intestinalis assemblage B]
MLAVQTAVATPLTAHALAMQMAMPVPAERASRVPVNTPSTRATAHFSTQYPQSGAAPVDGPLPLMRPRPLEACTCVMGRHPSSCVCSDGGSMPDAQ